MENILLWGSGLAAENIIKNKTFFEDEISIVGIIDNEITCWGNKLDEYMISGPGKIFEIDYDKIVITTDKYFKEIETQMVEQYGINPILIENRLYFAKRKLQKRYAYSEDKDIKKILNHICVHRLSVFNYPYVEKYERMDINVIYDIEANLYYVKHNGRRLYMKKELNTKEKVKEYYRDICIEQDKESPHRYMDKDFYIENGDIIVDVGVAEGNFSIENIEKASKIYMIETDKSWIEALKWTFSAYRDKVIILNRFISDYTAGNVVMLDDLIKEPVDFIKMDIEGNEVEALKGAKNLIEKAHKIKCSICTYHNDNDEVVIKNIAENYGMQCCFTEGYMFFPTGLKQWMVSPMLRKGVIRCKKRADKR